MSSRSAFRPHVGREAALHSRREAAAHRGGEPSNPRAASYGCVTVTVYATGLVCWPMSRIWTHSVPALVTPVICGVDPATTVDDAPAIGVQPASAGMPIARP